MVGALVVRSINPYGNGHDIQFSIDYSVPWASFELIPFILLGILGVNISNEKMYIYFDFRVYGAHFLSKQIFGGVVFEKTHVLDSIQYLK
jgi:hypothetical protein